MNDDPRLIRAETFHVGQRVRLSEYAKARGIKLQSKATVARQW